MPEKSQDREAPRDTAANIMARINEITLIRDESWDEWQGRLEDDLTALGGDRTELRDQIADATIQQALFEFAYNNDVFSEAHFLDFLYEEDIFALYGEVNFAYLFEMWQRNVTHALEQDDLEATWSTKTIQKTKFYKLHLAEIEPPLEESVEPMPKGFAEALALVKAADGQQVRRSRLEITIARECRLTREEVNALITQMAALGYLAVRGIKGTRFVELPSEEEEVASPARTKEAQSKEDPGFTEDELEAATKVLDVLQAKVGQQQKGQTLAWLSRNYGSEEKLTEPQFRSMVRRLVLRGVLDMRKMGRSGRGERSTPVFYWKSTETAQQWKSGDQDELLGALTRPYSKEKSEAAK